MTTESRGDKARTKMWSNIGKGLKIEAEFEITNLDERRIELEVLNSIGLFDFDTPDRMKAM